MNKIVVLLFRSADDYRSLLPRIIVGLVFLSEGIQKFLFPELGPGRFEKIGFAHPAFLASFVASFEIVCSILVLAGFSIRISAIPLLIVITTAIVTTKIPILINKGFWPMAHEARIDFALTLLLIFLLIYGSGKLSVDHIIQHTLKLH